MHICLITGEYPPMEGGVGAFTQALAQALRDLGHTLYIVTTSINAPSGNRATNLTDENGIAVYRVVSKWNRDGVIQALHRVRDLTPDIVNLQYEIAAYGMKGWITQLAHMSKGDLAAPLVVTFHDLLPPYLFPKAGPLRQWTVWHLAKSADGIIVTNAADLQQLRPKLQSHPSPIPMREIPIGSNINTEVILGYDRKQYRAHYGWQESDLVIGFFGFLNRSKGIDTLIRAMAILRDREKAAKLLLIGGRTGTSDPTNAAYAEEIDALIDHLSLEPLIARTGFASQQEVSAALYAVDVCALPYRDGVNLRRGTLHAALAHGCTIVTTQPTAPLSGLKNGVHALFVPPNNPVALADALQTIKADAALREKLSTAAAGLAQQFTWPQIAADSAAFFESLI